MTIIKPNRHSYFKFLAFIFTLLLAGGILYIFEYNALVDARFKLRFLKEKIVELEAINADLKNNLYKITEPRKLQELARSGELVLEQSPEFLSSEKWLSDSSR